MLKDMEGDGHTASQKYVQTPCCAWWWRTLQPLSPAGRCFQTRMLELWEDAGIELLWVEHWHWSCRRWGLWSGVEHPGTCVCKSYPLAPTPRGRAPTSAVPVLCPVSQWCFSKFTQRVKLETREGAREGGIYQPKFILLQSRLMQSS